MNEDIKAAKLERHLLKTQFPLECEEIPLEALSHEEQIVVIKCMDHVDLTDDEFTLLKKTLQRYRKAINEYRPTETIEAYEKTVQIIRTEQELLDILDNPINKSLKVNLTYEGQVYRLEFEILPIDDSRIIDYIQMNIDLFKDFSQEERDFYTRGQADPESLTSEEKIILQKMNEEISVLASQERTKLIDGFLASQLRLPESNQDYEKRLEFWNKFPFMEKWAIVNRVEDKLGLTEKSNEELFPVD